MNRFTSDTVQQKVFDLLLSKLGVEQPKTNGSGSGSRPRKKAVKAAPENGAKTKARGRKKGSVPNIVKDLNLRVGGKDAFGDLVKSKQPKSGEERSLLAIYFLRGLAAVKAVSADHVYTVYKYQGWKVPSNLRNQLQVISSTKGWLDTSDGSDIKLTVPGENYVEHDMAKPKAKAPS